MKPFTIGTVREFAQEERLKATLEAQARLDLGAVPAKLKKHVSIAAGWGLRDDALRQYHMSKHSMAEIFAVHDAIQQDLSAFEGFWKKIGKKVMAGDTLSVTEQCFWALEAVYGEVEAHISGHGRPTT